MLEKLRSKLVKPKAVAGVRLKITPSGHWEFALCVLTRKGNEIDVTFKKSNISTIDELSTFIDADIPVCLNVEGKMILHKSFENIRETDEEKLLNEIIPNTSPDNFIIQVDKRKRAFVSILRKEVVQNIVDKFVDKRMTIVNFSLGPFVLNDMTSIIDDFHSKNHIDIDDYSLEIQEGGIVSFSQRQSDNNSESVEIQGISLEKKYVIPFSSVFSYLLSLPSGSNIKGANEISRAAEEWEYRMLFKKVLRVCVIFILSLLVVNVLANFYLNDINQSLIYKAHLSDNLLKELQALTAEHEKKIQFIDRAKWQVESKMAFYPDRLASTIPSQIQLRELNLFPQDVGMLKKEKKVVFQHDRMEVLGSCDNSLSLNKWLKALKELTWIEEINSEQYKYNEELGAGEFYFVIIISG